MEHRFVLPGITLSQNQLDGKHWSVKHAQREYWHQAVQYIAQRCPFQPTYAVMEITRVTRRRIDKSNIMAGCKWLIDAYKETGWIVDDSPKWCEVIVDQRLCKKTEEPHMLIKITYPN